MKSFFRLIKKIIIGLLIAYIGLLVFIDTFGELGGYSSIIGILVVLGGVAYIFKKPKSPDTSSRNIDSSPISSINSSSPSVSPRDNSSSFDADFSSLLPSREKRDMKRRIKELEQDIRQAKVDDLLGPGPTSFEVQTGISRWESKLKGNRLEQMERELRELKRAYRRMD